MNRRISRARRGYTLIEVATSVVIVAALTAAVVPVVVKQIDEAEPTRAANDLNSISKGIETFHMNVRPTYPSDLYQLAVAIDTANLQMNGDKYLQKHEDAWKGPYISSNVPTTSAELNTGYGAKIRSELYWYASGSAFAAGTNPRAAGSTLPADTDFIVVKITGLTTDEFDRLDKVIDGSASSTAGRLRYTLDGSDVIAYFLAVPYSS